MTKRSWWWKVVPVVLVFVAVQGFLLSLDLERKGWEQIESVFPDRGIPRIDITLNGVSLDEINKGSKDTKYEGNELTLYDGREVREFDDVQVKGRGNGTWNWVDDKKPFRIKFNSKVDLFGMGKSKKWVLLTNHTDASNLRNDLAFYFANMLGMKYAYTGQFVEVYVDGEYRGLYYLTRAIEISKTTVNLQDRLGILVELDNIYGGDEEGFYEAESGDKFVVKDAVSEDDVGMAMEDFLNDYNELRKMIDEKNYEEVCKLIDTESAAQYYLLSEFSVNPDAYWTSFYFYKDGIDDKLHVGPAWDFDLAFANQQWGNWLGEKFYSPEETMIRRNEILPQEFYEVEGIENGYEASLKLSTVLFELMDVPEFREKVKSIYRERLSKRIGEIEEMIIEKQKLIQEAARKNDEKWGRDGFDNETERLLRWIRARYEFFEREYGKGDIMWSYMTE